MKDYLARHLLVSPKKPHRSTIYSPSTDFYIMGNILPGQSKSYTFAKPGIAQVSCADHP